MPHREPAPATESLKQVLLHPGEVQACDIAHAVERRKFVANPKLPVFPVSYSRCKGW